MEKKNLETLQAALKLEEDERAFFLAASEKTKERFGKLTFQLPKSGRLRTGSY